jgi:hypothetical protein
MNKSLLRLGLLISLTIPVSSLLMSSRIVFQGDLSQNGVSWNRPTVLNQDNRVRLGILNAEYPLVAQPFYVTSSENYDITLFESKQGSGEILFLYQTGFDSSEPTKNLVFGNDNPELNGSIYATRDKLSRVPLVANIQYILVVTSVLNRKSSDFMNTVGAFSVEITGPEESDVVFGMAPPMQVPYHGAILYWPLAPNWYQFRNDYWHNWHRGGDWFDNFGYFRVPKFRPDFRHRFHEEKEHQRRDFGSRKRIERFHENRKDDFTPRPHRKKSGGLGGRRH